MSGGDTGGRLVRPFALTGGRTEPSRSDFTLITLVTAAEPAPDRCGEGLAPEHLTILRRCRRPTAVAEIAAHLDLPVSVITIMLCDLLEDGKITVRPPLSIRHTPDPTLLKKVRDGLGRL